MFQNFLKPLMAELAIACSRGGLYTLAEGYSALDLVSPVQFEGQAHH